MCACAVDIWLCLQYYWADLAQTCSLGPLAMSRILSLRLIHAMHALTSKLQLTNRKYWENKTTNICNYKEYLCNYKLFGFVKLASYLLYVGLTLIEKMFKHCNKPDLTLMKLVLSTEDEFSPKRIMDTLSYFLSLRFKGTNPASKSRRIYPKYMPKCSLGSTDHVCKFLLKIFA